MLGVVVKGTPAQSSSVLVVGGKLIMNSGVTHRVFYYAFDIVVSLCRVHMPDKFGVQILRMIKAGAAVSENRSS